MTNIVVFHAYPRIFRSFREQTEQKRFTGPKVRSSVPSVVFSVPLEPFGRTIGPEYIVSTGFNNQQCRFVLFDPEIKRRQTASVFFCGVQ